MDKLDETTISRAILDRYHHCLAERLVSDVLIAGAGPAGLMAARELARRGLRVTVLEKRLAPGGGIWGGGMGMCQAVVPDEVLPLLNELGTRSVAYADGLHTVDSIELASRLCIHALDAGAVLLNLMTVDDVCVHDGRVDGLVVNRSLVGDTLPVDPITFSARAVLDTTGHEAVAVAALHRRGLLPSVAHARVEGPMNASAGETFVVENVSEVHPGLWVAGMSVCAALGGPRMGPIFGGMLLSGRQAAERIAAALTGQSE
jgi:thiazole biosynthesis enzyme